MTENKLFKICCSTFSKLANVNQLRLIDNSILFIESGGFAHMEGLRILDLSALNPGMFRGISGLKELFLFMNPISEIQMSTFASLKQLIVSSLVRIKSL